MATQTIQRVVALWHYSCPICCISDEETGYHAATDAIYCEVCIEMDGTHARLHRWPAEVETTQPGPAARKPAGRRRSLSCRDQRPLARQNRAPPRQEP